MEITPIPKTQRNDVWNKYQNKVINTIKKINKQMHTRERTKWREQMKYFKNKREEQRKSQGELKKYINYALQRPNPENKPLTMFEITERGTEMIDGEEKIKTKEREVTAKHMGKGRKRYYINNGKIIQELSQTEEGRKWRIKLHKAKLTEKEWEVIPHKLRPVLKMAEMVKTKTGEKMTTEKYGGLFNREIKIEELDKYLTTVKTTHSTWH